jgi:hypothetical protein
LVENHQRRLKITTKPEFAALGGTLSIGQRNETKGLIAIGETERPLAPVLHSYQVEIEIGLTDIRRAK